MESEAQTNQVPVWYVGLHDSKRMLPITEEVLRAAQSANVRLQLLEGPRDVLITPHLV
jgi:hypothetical protein